MFVQLKIMQSSKYARVRRTLPTNQRYVYRFHVSQVNNVYFNFEMHMGKWRHCVPQRSGTPGDEEDFLLLHGIEPNLSFTQSTV